MQMISEIDLIELTKSTTLVQNQSQGLKLQYGQAVTLLRFKNEFLMEDL